MPKMGLLGGYHCSPCREGFEQIGKNLLQQFEALSIRTRFKQRFHLDSLVKDTKKFCYSLCLKTKDERILFHYNTWSAEAIVLRENLGV